MNYEQKTKKELIAILHGKDNEIAELDNTLRRIDEHDISTQKEIEDCKKALSYQQSINEVLEKTVVRLNIEETIRRYKDQSTPVGL